MLNEEQKELTKLLHRQVKMYNDFFGEVTAEYNEDDYVGIFDVSTPEESHENWCNVRKSQGWVYGEVKDLQNKTHPCLVPYEELPERQKIKDLLAQAIVWHYRDKHYKVGVTLEVTIKQ